jgi:chromosome segregation ATPase
VPSERGAAVASQTDWQQWVADRIEAHLAEFAEHAGKQTREWLDEIGHELGRKVALLEREVVQLREQLGLARELKKLRSDVEQARAEVPKMPAIVQRLEEGQARLHGAIARTQEKLSKVRVDQSLADSKLKELARETKRRAADVEMKIESTVASFSMTEIHPEAAAALRDFATGALEGTRRDEKIFVFDPNPTAGAA